MKYEAAEGDMRWGATRGPIAGSERETSYLPPNAVNVGHTFTRSRYRSRSSRAAATSVGSFFTFGFAARFGFSFTGGAGGMKCNRQDAVVSGGVDRRAFAVVLSFVARAFDPCL